MVRLPNGTILMTHKDIDAAWAAVLREALRPEEDEQAYRTAISELRKFGSDAVFPIAIAAADDEREAVRELVPDVLRYFEPHTKLEESATKVAEMLRVERSSRVLAALAGAFVDLKHPVAKEVLPPLLHHHDSEVRECAIHGLLEVLDAYTIAHFILASGDSAEEVRNWATFGLRLAVEYEDPETFDNEPIARALGERLGDSHSETRAEAVLALARINDDRIVPVLLREFEALPEWDHFIEAAEVLAKGELAGVLNALAMQFPEEAKSLENAISASEQGVPYRR